VLVLTEAGERARADGEERARAVIDRVITPEDGAALTAVLDRVRTRLAETEEGTR
jgi:hypothetical protein